jgi:DNA repair exonuclease SbcCD ATPase subunit
MNEKQAKLEANASIDKDNTNLPKSEQPSTTVITVEANGKPPPPPSEENEIVISSLEMNDTLDKQHVDSLLDDLERSSPKSINAISIPHGIEITADSTQDAAYTISGKHHNMTDTEISLEQQQDHKITTKLRAVNVDLHDGSNSVRPTVAIVEQHSFLTTDTGDKEKIARLEAELLQAESLIVSMRRSSGYQLNGTTREIGTASDETDSKAEDDRISSNQQDHAEITSALQLNLEQQMNAKAEAENKARLLESKILILEQELCQQKEEVSKMDSMQENLQIQMTAKAEAENKARSAYDRIQQLELENDKKIIDLKVAHQQLVETRETIVEKDQELEKVRSERDEYERKATVLTTRLNAVKKKEAVKVNHVDEIEDDLKVALNELEQTKSDLEQALTEKTLFEQKLLYTEKLSKEHIDHLENALKEEQKLNEERKIKMTEYVEKKAQELRQIKEENDSLQVELTQNNRSLVDLNNRWKQLHTQWVQAQTRNRELQRDLHRTKKDSENLHKQGDTLEMKLSRSTNETEEHKNKRLAAKQELMSVLHTLENERDLTAKIRDVIKFTLTPNVLNQQKVVKELIEEFGVALEKLSIRLGKPLLTLPSDTTQDEAPSNNGLNNRTINSAYGEGTTTNSDIILVVEKLENESQRLSDAISAVATNVDRLLAVVHASGDRTCFTVLSELVSTGTMDRSPALQAERAAISNPLATIGRSHRYGQVPGASDNF